ncbi:hypothetical protein B0G71_6879 [Paraburkholderia sp. BL27I4N3]|uniref:hypothetical protein n=1 Tax=Paraburkholderia sp. BL27I4N3 TaxID=1938805 RepID=UPI000E228FA4|nr:hypothetical protein [Paraburkholderia sp. BL27I4N3]REE23603.1 hypothetical protein B0G71_6879 [Paraburkholderia sp. BL27I4N3]
MNRTVNIREAEAAILLRMAEAPRVTLPLALCVGAIVLGPRRTIVIAGHSGITAWLGGTVRKVLLSKTQAAAADSRSRSA